MKKSLALILLGAVAGVLIWLNVLRIMAGRQDLTLPSGNVLPPLSSAPAPTQSKDVSTERAAAVVEKVVVNINTVGRPIPDTSYFGFGGFLTPEGAGSGVIVRKDGFIVTNNHVIEDAQTIDVTLSNGKKVRGELWARDPAFDLAVVKIPLNNLPTAVFANSDDIHVGDPVIAVGNALALGETVTSGIISALARSVEGPEPNKSLQKAIQTDAAINRGNSGGALALLDGRVVGINTAILSTNSGGGNIGIGFAIPSNTVYKVVSELIRHRKYEAPSPAWIGIQYLPNSREISQMLKERYQMSYPSATAGVIVDQVVPGGPAERAGIKAFDNILTVDGKPVNGTRGFAYAIHAHKPGDTVKITVWRPALSRKLTIAVKLSAMPVNVPQQQPQQGPTGSFGLPF